MGIGRPTSLDDKVQATIVQVLKEGNTWRCAAGCAGVSWTTVKNWMQRGEAGEEPYATFLALTRGAEASVEREMVIGVRMGGAAGGDWKANAWWLERRRWKDWWLQKPGRGERKDPSTMTDDEIKDVLVAELAKWAHGDDAFVDKVIARLRK